MIGVALIAGFAGIGAMLSSDYNPDASYHYVSYAFFIISAFFIWPLARFHLRRQPVVVMRSGLATSCAGRICRFIKWTDVRRIENIRYFDTGRGADCELYILYGKNGHKLRFDDGLVDLRGLLDRVNEGIRESRPEMIRYDRGRDTLAAHRRRAETEPGLERIPRQGIKTRLNKL